MNKMTNLEEYKKVSEDFNNWKIQVDTLNKVKAKQILDIKTNLFKEAEEKFKDGTALRDEYNNFHSRAQVIMMKINPDLKFKNALSAKILKGLNHFVSSKTIVVYDPKANGLNGAKIVVGAFGYGLRYNVNSRKLCGWHDLRNVLEKSNEIVAGLKKCGLWKEAQVFEKMVGVLPNLSMIDGGSITIPFDNPIDGFDSNNRAVKIRGISFCRGFSSVSLQASTEFGDRNLYINPTQGAYCYYNYTIVKDKLPEFIEKAEEISKQYDFNKQKVLEQLDSILGRWLLLHSI